MLLHLDRSYTNRHGLWSRAGSFLKPQLSRLLYDPLHLPHNLRLRSDSQTSREQQHMAKRVGLRLLQEADKHALHHSSSFFDQLSDACHV